MARALRRRSVATPTSPELPPLLGEVFTLSEAALLASPYVAPVMPPERRRSRLGVVGLSVIVLLFVGSVAAVAFDRLSMNQLLPGTSIGGVKVGSRSVDDAIVLLQQEIITPLRTETVVLDAPEMREQATAWELGVRVDVARGVRDVLARQESGPLVARMYRRVAGQTRNYPLHTVVDQPRLQAFLDAATQRIDRPAKDATVEVQGETLHVVPHQIGRQLDAAAAQRQLVRALEMGERRFTLPVVVTQPQLRTEQFAKVILVHTAANRLDLYLDGKLFTSYPVATGSPGYPTPHGQFSIVAKRRNPGWGNPGASWSVNMPAYIPPGPGNPLGTRAMNLSAGGIRIHGTPDTGSIGRAASHGCIRMFMHDAERLFDQIDVGTPVIIVGA